MSTGHGFSYEPTSEQEYYNLLKNSHKLKITNEEVDKAKIFVYVYSILSKVYSPLIPGSKNEDKEFWLELKNLLENYDSQKDELIKNLKIQLEKKDRHTINYNLLG